jgi:NADPH2:quinone reductase
LFYRWLTLLIAYSSGEVVEVGPNVTEFKVGDRVAYIDAGSYAEYTSVGTLSAGKIPDNLSYSDATSAILQGLTAWTMVRDAYAVKKGGKIIICGDIDEVT